MLYRGWGAAFYQTSAAPPLWRCVLPYLLPRLQRRVLSYLCRGCDTPRFIISLPRLGRCVLPYLLLRLQRRVLSYLLPRLRHAAFCHIPAAPPLGRGVLPYPCRAAVCHAPAPLSAAWLSGSTSNSVRASSPSSAPHTVRIAVNRFSVFA